MTGSGVIAQAGGVSNAPGKTPPHGMTLLGVRVTAQLLGLALATLGLTLMIAFAIYQWAARS